MTCAPAILTNMAFRQSAVWREATTTICRDGESPDTLGPLTQALRLLRQRSRFDVVVTMGPRPSLAYGLLCAVLGLPSRQIMTEIFLDPPRPASLGWRVKTGLFRWVARRSLGILTNSSAEVGLLARRFSLPETRLRFVEMYTTILEPAAGGENDGFVLSIGRTLRDLDTLAEAAREIQAPVLVVAGARDRIPAPLPANVQVLKELPLAETRRLIGRAAVVVIPLLPSERSAGQVVLFEAMAMGKPVVATRAVGTRDYVRDGENGLLVEPGDARGLADAVKRLLENPEPTRQMSNQALADCFAKWMPNHHARHKIAAIASLWRAAASSGDSNHA